MVSFEVVLYLSSLPLCSPLPGSSVPGRERKQIKQANTNKHAIFSDHARSTAPTNRRGFQCLWDNLRYYTEYIGIYHRTNVPYAGLKRDVSLSSYPTNIYSVLHICAIMEHAARSSILSTVGGLCSVYVSTYSVLRTEYFHRQGERHREDAENTQARQAREARQDMDR